MFRICTGYTYFRLILLQSAEISILGQKNFLTGIETSGLPAILPFVEQMVRGERV